MRVLKLTVAYDGTRFVGWQRQAEGESIQGLLEQVLERLNGSPVMVSGAGRTDAGVHALGQVASVALTCRHDVQTLMRAVNAQLPPDIRVRTVEDVPSDFHARFSARAKTYRYQLRDGGLASPFDGAFVWHLPETLDIPAMQAAAGALVGTHDFGAFQSVGTPVSTSVRTITRSEVTRVPSASALCPALLVYEATGNGFLRHMVRAIVGTLVEVGRGRREVATMSRLLAGAPRSEAGATAPPQGLFLVGVEYD